MSASSKQEKKDIAGVPIDWSRELEGEVLTKIRDQMIEQLSQHDDAAVLLEALAYWLYFFSRHVLWLSAYFREPIHMKEELAAHMKMIDNMINDFETKRKQDH
jgi:hypothetical protein